MCMWGAQYKRMHIWVVFSLLYRRLYIRCFWRGIVCLLSTIHVDVFPCLSWGSLPESQYEYR